MEIKVGSYMMGSPENEENRSDDEVSSDAGIVGEFDGREPE